MIMWRRAVAATIVAVMMISLSSASWAHDDPEEDEPGHVAMNEWTGFISCAVSTPVVTSAPCGLFDPNQDFIHEFTAQPDLQTIVVAMEWDAQPVLGAERLRILLEEANSGQGDEPLMSKTGSSPIEFRVDAGEGFEPVEEEWDLRVRVFPTFETQVVYQQTFTVHYHLFYGIAAPSGYSALPSDH